MSPRACRRHVYVAPNAVLQPARSLGHPHLSLGLDGFDGFDGSAVLFGQPVHVEVQVDPRGGDRAVPSLGLDRLAGHPRLEQTGEAGVAQLVAGAMAKTGPLAGGAYDLVQARHREWLTPTNSFERDEERLRRRPFWSLVVHVAGDCGEEGRRQRHQAFVSALALGDEHPPLAQPQVGEPPVSYTHLTLP